MEVSTCSKRSRELLPRDLLTKMYSRWRRERRGSVVVWCGRVARLNSSMRGVQGPATWQPEVGLLRSACWSGQEQVQWSCANRSSCRANHAPPTAWDCGDSAAAHAEHSFMSNCRIGRDGAGGQRAATEHALGSRSRAPWATGTSRRSSGCALGRQQARKALVTPRGHPGAATPLRPPLPSRVCFRRLGMSRPHGGNSEKLQSQTCMHKQRHAHQ